MFAVKLIIALAALALLAMNVRQSMKVSNGHVTLDWARVGFWSVVAIAVIFGLLPSMGQVPSGFRGVVLRFGATTGEVKSEGLYFLPPFVESIALMDVQVHAHKASATSASKDLQNVAAEITLNYRLDPLKAATIYRDLRNDYEVRIIAPSVQEAVKATTARFDAEKLITERPMVSSGIEEALRTRLASHGILIDQMSSRRTSPTRSRRRWWPRSRP
jgi:regulator of protease activity HflC (stomatin/prohibitin superfamily)